MATISALRRESPPAPKRSAGCAIGPWLLALLPLVMACDGRRLGKDEEREPNYCTVDWMCDTRSGAVTPQPEGGCENGSIPAICLYYWGDTDPRDQEVYCHDPALFENACLYESRCVWDEEAGYYVIWCTNQNHGMP